nr:hypothetical protein [Nanoarchaeum sp.]
MLSNLIILGRLHKWFVNIVVLLHGIFYLDYFDLKSTSRLFAGLIIFCFLSSAGYIINNFFNKEKDLFNPVNIQRAEIINNYNRYFILILTISFIIFPIIMALFIDFHFGFICFMFILWQFLYTLFFREVFIVDVLAIGIGYILRGVAGAYLIKVPINASLIFFIFCLSCFIIFCKRRHELLLDKDIIKFRRVLVNYNLKMLNFLIFVSSFLSLVFYLFVSFSHLFSIVTLPIVFLSITRYRYLVYFKNKGLLPERDLFLDKPLLANYLIYSFVILYFIFHKVNNM